MKTQKPIETVAAPEAAETVLTVAEAKKPSPKRVKVGGYVYEWNGEWWVSDDLGHQKGLSPEDPRLETAEEV